MLCLAFGVSAESLESDNDTNDWLCQFCLDDLVARIPQGTQKALHDLLRARFTRVRRMRDGELR
jgi:hypothetical protein